jgi:hypothetical protein
MDRCLVQEQYTRSAGAEAELNAPCPKDAGSPRGSGDATSFRIRLDRMPDIVPPWIIDRVTVARTRFPSPALRRCPVDRLTTPPHPVTVPLAMRSIQPTAGSCFGTARIRRYNW